MMKNLLTGVSEVQADLVRVSFIYTLYIWCRKDCWKCWEVWQIYSYMMASYKLKEGILMLKASNVSTMHGKDGNNVLDNCNVHAGR